MTYKNNKQISKILENSKVNKMQQNMVVMYQFGERLHCLQCKRVYIANDKRMYLQDF